MSKRLKILILERGLKQRQIADELGWCESKVSDIASGRRMPNDVDQVRLAKVLKLKP